MTDTKTEAWVEALVVIVRDFRARRLRHMKENPECLKSEDYLPPELSREAEMRAILSSPTFQEIVREKVEGLMGITSELVRCHEDRETGDYVDSVVARAKDALAAFTTGKDGE